MHYVSHSPENNTTIQDPIFPLYIKYTKSLLYCTAKLQTDRSRKDTNSPTEEISAVRTRRVKTDKTSKEGGGGVVWWLTFNFSMGEVSMLSGAYKGDV